MLVKFGKADFARSSDKQVIHGQISVGQNLIFPLNIAVDEKDKIFCVIYIEDSTFNHYLWGFVYRDWTRGITYASKITEEH